MTTFNQTYDTATPAGGDDPAEADDRMREIKAALQERLNVDHYCPLTGTELSDASVGEHRKATLRTGSAPAAVADKLFVYAKDVDGKVELFCKDEDGNEMQLTSGGSLLSASLDMKDEDDMASDSATHAATQQSIKAYADAIAAVAALPDDDAFGSLASKVSGTIYQAASDGFVMAVCKLDSGAGEAAIAGYVGSSSPPTTLISYTMEYESAQYRTRRSIMFPVKKNDYWKCTITTSGSGTKTIYWQPVGA